MNRDTLEAAIAEAERFLNRAKAITASVKRVRAWFTYGPTFLDDSINPEDRGAVRRSSINSTRSISNLRTTS